MYQGVGASSAQGPIDYKRPPRANSMRRPVEGDVNAFVSWRSTWLASATLSIGDHDMKTQ